MVTTLKFTLLAFFIFTVGCSGWAYRSPSDSMSPTITQNDMAVANPYEYWFEPIRRLDIVVVKAPESIQQRSGKTGDVRFIKRIIGLPREKVEIRLGKVMINDKPLVEPFRKMKSTDDFGPIIVPKNEFFLLGDNRPNSEDSRYWKPATISKKDIYSKIVEIKKDYYKND